MELGGSLPVENVQNLASNYIKEIPQRYIRPEIEVDEISVDDSLHIPVIDMDNLTTNYSSYENEMMKLHQACKDWGFFQVKHIYIYIYVHTVYILSKYTYTYCSWCGDS